MKILVCTPCIPSKQIINSSQSAIHIQSYFSLIELKKKHTIFLQIIFDDNRIKTQLEDYEKKLLATLKNKKIKILKPIFLSSLNSLTYRYGSRRLLKIISENVIFKTYKLYFKRTKILKKIRPQKFDRILLYLSPESTALFYKSNEKRICFEGDYHYQSFESNMEKSKLSLNLNSLLTYSVNKLTLIIWRILYVKILKDYNNILFASFNIFNLFKKRLSNSDFIGTLWPDQIKYKDESSFKRKKLNIILHIGNLNNTAGSFALKFIYDELADLIEDKVNKDITNFIIIGNGTLEDKVEKRFKELNFTIKKWVEDLDKEMRSCDIFVFLNNAGPLKAIFSRQIYAWSLGLCVLVHSNSLKTIKQMKDNYNVMSGTTNFEIIEKLNYLIASKSVRDRIGINGLKTFQSFFSPKMHTNKLLSYLR